MFNVDVNNLSVPNSDRIPLTCAIGRRGCRRNTEMYANVLSNLKEISGNSQTRPDIAAKIFVDPRDATKVYAVGLMALQHRRKGLAQQEIKAFQNAYQEYLVNRFLLSDHAVVSHSEVQVNQVHSLDKLLALFGAAKPENDYKSKEIFELLEKASKGNADKDSQLQFVIDELDDLLECPISFDTFKDPVICSDGHTYERSSIKDWLSSRNTSPMTGNQLADDGESLEANALVRQVADWFREYRE